MIIAFVGSTVTETKSAFRCFIKENTELIKDSYDDHVELTTGDTIYTVSLTKYSSFLGTYFDEIIWIGSCGMNEKANIIRTRLTDNAPIEYREQKFDY